MLLDTLHKQLLETITAIQQTQTFSELKLLREKLFAPYKETSSIPDLVNAVKQVNRIHDWMNKQSIVLALRQLEASGMGKPPVPYAFVIFGSGGRQEQALLSDQDNGLIYLLPSDMGAVEQEACEQYFSQLSSLVVQGLAEAGYPPCQGNVICTNPRWRGSLSHWSATLNGYCADPTWEHMRYMLVAGDSRFLFGDESLFFQFQYKYHQLLAGNADIVRRLVSNTLRYRVPLSWFGRILPEVTGKFRGAINVKNGLYLPFVNCIRLWSLANGIKETSTLERLSQLQDRKLLPWELCVEMSSHIPQILGLRLLTMQHWQEETYEHLSYVKLNQLPKEFAHSIKQAMKVAVRLQEITSRRYLPKE